MWTDYAAVAAGYGLGCFTAGYYWVRWRTGRDIRDQGSGGVGARNVGRALGPAGFVLVFLLDFAKGALAVTVARGLEAGPVVLVATVVAVVAGHLWPVQLRFRGGKGISVSLGALAFYDGALALVLAGLFLAVWAVWRRFTPSGLVAFGLLPLASLAWRGPGIETLGVLVLAVLIAGAHRDHLRQEIARLRTGRFVKEKSVDTGNRL